MNTRTILELSVEILDTQKIIELVDGYRFMEQADKEKYKRLLYELKEIKRKAINGIPIEKDVSIIVQELWDAL